MKKAFTLIELLTVLVISSILMTIILLPLIQSFNFTRTAQAFVEAQERARRLISQVTAEISNGVGVRDNEGTKGSIAVVVPGQDGNMVSVLLPHSKIDIAMPAQGDPSARRDGAYINPNTGRADPTSDEPLGQVSTPAAPGMSYLRYFIGLRYPLASNNLDPARYANPYEGTLAPASSGVENLYVLYRVRYQPYVFDGTQLSVNTDLFTDDGNNVPGDWDDPYFFVQDPPGQALLPPAERAAKALRIRNWLAKATVVSELSRFDMILPVYNRQTGAVTYDGNLPRLVSLAQFQPTTVANSPALPQTVLRIGEESERPDALQSDIFRTEKGAWSKAVIRVYPSDYDAASATLNHYLVARMDSAAGDRKLRIYRYDPDNDNDGDDRNGEGVNGNDDMEVFDIGAYNDAISDGQTYPFTRAVSASNTRSNWMADTDGRAAFSPFFVDSAAGKVYFSFPITQVGDVSVAPGADNNRPYLDTGPALTPTSDTGLGGNFYDVAFSSVNRYFNKLWVDMQASALPDMRPDVHRFIDLRVTANSDGTRSPLYPDPTTGFPSAFIVPGSEIVYGPDQLAGAHYGQVIRYTRTTRNPGPNQYKINYTDLEEPDYAALGLTAPPVNYDPTDFVSAIVQPRYKVGYLQLNSDPNNPLPPGQVSVYYRFQLIGPGDTVTVDYDTREAINIELGLRSYPRTNQPIPQILSLQGTASVRNFLK